MIKIKLVGAGGYGGVGAIEIFARHPEAQIVALIDVVDIGKKISDLYPHLSGTCDLPIISAEQDDVEADAVFFATPDRVGMQNAPAYFKKGYKIVDYSGDFRFGDKKAYAEYASRINLDVTHQAEDLLPHTAYGLAELHRDEISKAKIIGNPGCFAVSAILGTAPPVKEKLIDLGSLVLDAKTGVSGGGKNATAIFHFPHRYEEMNAYKMCKHQHVMEIEHELGIIAGSALQVTFTSQVVPVVRGIMTTIYAKVTAGTTYESVLEAYKDFYKDEPFVGVYDESSSVGNRNIRGTNRCALWINLDRRTNTMIVVSHIDNLLKGQAGSAVQNLNILFGLPETSGLCSPGMYP